MAMIHTLHALKETGPYAWPGGYPLAFYLAGAGIVLCHDCATEALTEAVRDDVTQFVETGKRGKTARELQLTAEIVDSDQLAYGGVACECGAWIGEPVCPECGDELVDASQDRSAGLSVPVLHCETADAVWLCQHCAAKLVANGQARRLPGVGIEILATVPEADRAYRWDDGTPWYSRAGAVYEYPQINSRIAAERERAFWLASVKRETERLATEHDLYVQCQMQRAWPHAYSAAHLPWSWPQPPYAQPGI